MNDREKNEKADLDQTARQIDEAAREGAVVEVDPDDADDMGAFKEDALDPDDADDSRFDREA